MRGIWLLLLLLVGGCRHHQSKKERIRELEYHQLAERTKVVENGSYYGQLSTQTYLPKTVYVHSYIKRDGTYVQSHWRSHR